MCGTQPAEDDACTYKKAAIRVLNGRWLTVQAENRSQVICCFIYNLQYAHT